MREEPRTWLVFYYYENAKGFMGINEKIKKEIKDKILRKKNESYRKRK